VVDGSGNVFIADTGNSRIVEIPTGSAPIVLSTGAVTLSNPVSLALDGAGNLYIADSKAAPANAPIGGEVVRVTPQGAASIIVANATPFYASQGTVIETLGAPTAITVDNLGDLYIVNGDGAVLRQNPELLATIVLPPKTEFSGTALSATASAIITDSNSNFYIADTGNNRIVTFNELTGVGSVVSAGSVTLSGPSGVAEDAAGNLYVADANGITLIESTGTVESLPFGTLSSSGATGVAVDAAGDIFVAAGGQNSVFDLIVSSATIAFGEQAVGSTSPVQSVTLFNIGNAPLVIGAAPNPTVDAGDLNFAPASGTCAPGASIAVDATCTLAATFTPQSAGTLTGQLILAANTASGSIVINLTGAASTVAKFSITGLPSKAPSGGTLNFTVTAEDAQGNPLNGYQGTVTFTSSDGAAVLPQNYTFTAADNSVHQFQVTFNTAGEQTITVTDTTTGASGTGGPVDIQASAAAIAVSAGSNQSAPLGQAFTTNLAALVTDSSNNPVPGALVTFTAPSTGASGTFAGGGISAQSLSNSSGIATAPVFSANGTLGSYAVAASVSGVSATANFNLTNTAGLSSTALKVSPASPSTFGQPLTFTATVSIGGGSSTLAGPTGNVTFNDGTTAIATVALVPVTPSNGTSTATLVVPSSAASALSGGTHAFTASYSGDANYQASASSPAVPYTISLAQVTLTGPTTTLNGVQGQVVTIPIAIAGQFTGVGIPSPTGTITAAYCLLGSIVSQSATAASPCGFNSATPPVAYPQPIVQTVTIANGAVSFTLPSDTPAGSFVIGFTYSGDVNYQPVTAPTTVDVVIPGFAFAPYPVQAANSGVQVSSTSPATVVITQPASGTAQVALSINEAAGYGCGPVDPTLPAGTCTAPASPYTITFSCSGLPKNVTCAFLPASAVFEGPDNTGAKEIELDVTTVSPPFITSDARTMDGHRVLSAGLFWLPGLLLAGYLGFRRRRLPAWGRGMLAMLVLASGLMGLSACGGMHTDAATGTYNFMVNATGPTTAGGQLTLSIPVKLTITN
jgi:sugar lactone lactonase YvrE